jgi:hypothetical protein
MILKIIISGSPFTIQGTENTRYVDFLHVKEIFFRFNPDGTFASRASVTDQIVLGSNGEFTSTGVVDYDANGKLLTTGCFRHTATRLTAGFDRHGNEWNH